MVFSFHFIQEGYRVEVFVFSAFRIIAVFVVHRSGRIVYQSVSIYFAVVAPTIGTGKIGLFVTAQACVQFQFVIEHAMSDFYTRVEHLVVCTFDQAVQTTVFEAGHIIGRTAATAQADVVNLCERCTGHFVQPVG